MVVSALGADQVAVVDALHHRAAASVGNCLVEFFPGEESGAREPPAQDVLAGFRVGFEDQAADGSSGSP